MISMGGRITVTMDGKEYAYINNASFETRGPNFADPALAQQVARFIYGEGVTAEMVRGSHDSCCAIWQVHVDENDAPTPPSPKSETVDHPAHYNQGQIEVIAVIEDWKLGFHEGNALKYLARYKHKGGIEDLKKARWYLDRLIEQAEQ
jgi:hypothetical protein